MVNEWSMKGKIKILPNNEPENRFTLRRFGKVNVLKNICISSNNNNKIRKYSFPITKL
jgi:hypothetical protein